MIFGFEAADLLGRGGVVVEVEEFSGLWEGVVFEETFFVAGLFGCVLGSVSFHQRLSRQNRSFKVMNVPSSILLAELPGQETQQGEEY